ncbi:MAG TPA: CHAT domain-containing protein [Chthoniobacterales bacterium]|nr:CHAT domain-containing protein [Chthoniobacterales bacterium]
MKRPVLILQSVYFHQSDREEALRLGSDLYGRLTRPIDDPLAHGPGISVLVGVEAESVDVAAADTVVLIPVLGSATRGLMVNVVLRTLADWHAALGPGHVLTVPISANWRSDEGKLPGKQMLSMLYGRGDPRRATLDEIVLAVSRLWNAGGQSPQLFISHAKADLTATDEAAKKIHAFAVTDTTGKAFFDATDLRPGESLEGQLDDAVTRGVLISVRGDVYSSRVWCQREVLVAKLHGMPVLAVEILRRGELRSSPYGGNSPSLVWDGNPSPIVSQAMVEWLRSEFFRREARRIITAANLPQDVAVVARPPELLDLAQGPLRSERAQLVLHPDPELSVIERRVLKAARPRLHLATPSTAFRRLLSRGEEAADVASPLEGMQVAMSLSDSPDAGGPEGFTAEHAKDATVAIARTLISAGAAIAYGGDFRPGGFTPLLAQLIQNYNQTATKTAQDLHSYLAAIISPGDAPENIPLSIHHLAASPDMAAEAILSPPTKEGEPPNALYFSDMRRVMEKHIAARVILGGNADARTEAGGAGYGGRYPGVVEEAWRSLEIGNPLYVSGGFGGAAAIVADLLEGKAAPEKLQDGIWMQHPYFAKNAGQLDAHPMRKKLGLPETMAELAAAIKNLAGALLKNDEASLAWNGLSVKENQLLFRTRDSVMLSALISKGLLGIARAQAAGILQIELVHDSLTAAEKLDAVAIATLDGVPLGGAGAAIDQLTGGIASEARSAGRTLVSLQDTIIDAEWLFLASLGALGDSAGILGRIEQAAAETCEEATRHGFQRVGVVSFGGNVLADTQAVASAMIRGFSKSPRRPVLVWHETDDTRFNTLCDTLGRDSELKLTTRQSLARIAAEPGPREPMILHVRLEDDHLEATCLLPSSAAVVPTIRTKLSPAELSRLAEGSGPRKRSTPNLETLEQRGEELAERLFGKQASAILAACRDSRMVVMHDTAASKVPFEMLLAPPDLRPALAGGITRRLSISGLAFERQFAQPPKKAKLKILLIANPTRDLPGAAREAEAVRKILLSQSDRLELEELWENEATEAKVADALARADILHYCGHAFFDGPGPAESGLVLAGPTPFTGEDLGSVARLPRIAFVNACEAGRVRGEPATNAAAFAELFLQSGMDAYLGTFWEVGDSAAERFAGTVYTKLAIGETLEQAALAGRNALFAAREPDWANYMLVGGANFRLISGR